MKYVTLTPLEAQRRCRQLSAQIEHLVCAVDRIDPEDKVANRSIRAMMREWSFYQPMAMFWSCSEGEQKV